MHLMRLIIEDFTGEYTAAVLGNSKGSREVYLGFKIWIHLHAKHDRIEI